MINDRDFDDVCPETIRDILRNITGKQEGVWCNNWDPDEETPIFDIGTGECIGMLQPIDYDAIEANPFLQPWSKRPKTQ